MIRFRLRRSVLSPFPLCFLHVRRTGSEVEATVTCQTGFCAKVKKTNKAEVRMQGSTTMRRPINAVQTKITEYRHNTRKEMTF